MTQECDPDLIHNVKHLLLQTETGHYDLHIYITTPHCVSDVIHH